jgi:hypothetical protein
MEKKHIILIIVLIVIGYGVYVLKDKVIAPTSNQQGVDYEIKFKSDQEKAGLQEDEDSKEMNENNEEENQEEETEEDNIFIESETDKICNEKCKDKYGPELNECLINCRKKEREKEDAIEEGEEEPKTCEEMTQPNKDNCLKERAIENKSDATCQKIEDAAIKDKCVNAVAEAILDSL